MCIAILNTKGVTLKKELLNNCWKNNGDGAGMLFSNGEYMETIKEMSDFELFYQKYLDVRKQYSKSNIVLHFRISTHGKVNETNCHPFLVDDNLGFVHNGMIYDVPTSPDFSDTYMFNEVILKKIKPGFEYDENILDMLELYIGSGSKLIFLNSDDDFAIVNEKAGHWNLGCWFSNSSYKQVNDWVDFGGIKKSKSSVAGYQSFGSQKKTVWSYDASKYENKVDYGFYDDWYSDGDKDKHSCSDCGIYLYGVNEINRGTCEWCHEEQMALLENRPSDAIDMCEGCFEDYGKYNEQLEAFVCESCLLELEPNEVLAPASNCKVGKNVSTRKGA
jgi:hypothetical protein